MTQTLEQRFFKKVIKQEGCWKWTASKHVFGYGMIREGGLKQKITAQRASWIIHFGEVPDGMHILHKCDNPECTNPEHLFLGTNLDNIKDMVSKDRSHHAIPASQRKLIRELREAGASWRGLARIFKVDRKAIRTAIRKIS